MGRKNMMNLFVLAALFTALFAVSAYALPDNPPTCSLSSSTTDTETTAVLTVVSVDTLENAGVDTIRIYEDGTQISSKSCGLTATCVSTKTVTKTVAGDYSYRAVCRDRSGQETSSSTKTVHFDGSNRPPVIDSSTPATPLTVDEDVTTTFRITAHDPEDDTMTYSWKVDGANVAGATGTSYSFQRDVTGTSRAYDVAVYVSDGRGGMDLHAWRITVRDLEPELNLHKESGTTECDTFNFHVAVDSYDSISSYSWNFGDGTTSSDDATASHRFAENGTYTVRVDVTDSDGDVVHDTLTVTVGDIVPTVNAGSDQTVDEGELVSFSGTATMPCAYDSIISRSWDFGDGSSASGSTATHTYTTADDYTVIFTVCDQDSCRSDSMIVHVEDVASVIDLHRESGATECDTFSFHVDVSSALPIVSYSWNFGDGTASSDDATAGHRFAENGTYTVRVNATDSSGDVVSDSIIVVVGDIAPSVNAGRDQSVSEGQRVNFTGTATMPCTADSILGYSWNFGDGMHGIGRTSSHTYASAGFYTVTFRVCDDDSCVSDTLTVVVVGTAPSADFRYAPTDPVEDEEVRFYDYSVSDDAIDSWHWTFGDGSSSTDQNPSHTYADDGDYEVCLNVTDVEGVSDEHCETIHVGAESPWTVDLVLNATDGAEPLSVFANCSAVGGMSPYVFSIDFGDGTVVAASSEAHTYVPDGTYDVVCAVTDARGEEQSDSETVTVADTEPVVDFTWDPESPAIFENVSFDATATAYDGVASYSWEFGDGTTSDVEDPRHAYSAAGDYVVELVVTDADGSTATAAHTVHVSENPPVVELAIDVTEGYEPLTVDVDCTATGGDGALDYEIDFGDGSSSDGSSATHTYLQNGTYEIVCTATDATGNSASDSVDVEVLDTEPEVSFVYEPDDAVEGEAVDFDSTVVAYDMPVTYEWDFGDGDFSTDADPSHVYDADGTYVVVLTVTDSDGSVVTATEEVTIGMNAAEATIIASATSGYEPLSVDFGCVALAGNPPYVYSIDFGDGESASTGIAAHTYDQNGTYTAVCTITDADGDVSEDDVVITVLDTVPDVDFTYLPADPEEGESVEFDGTIDAYDEPVSWEWDFGDGETSTDADPEHAYADAGRYNVTLTATDADGSVVVASHVVVVGNNEPFVNLLADPLAGPEGLEVEFNCTVVGGNAPLDFEMDYGDGSAFGDSQESVHSYDEPGSYVATCTVTDDDGDSDSDFVIINVANNAPVVDLTATPVPATEGEMIAFECMVTGGDEPLDVLLEFGDGEETDSLTATHAYAEEGLYTARCTANDSDGDIGTDSEVITITNNEPVVNLVADPTSGLEPLTVTYNCTVGAGNAPFDYFVDFGDGSTSTSPSGTHDYPEPGTYPLSCRVDDVDGDWDEDVVGIHVIDNPPVVDLIAVPTEGLEGMTVVFTCNVAGGNAPFEYVLDFGDGSSTTSSSATHTYPFENVYNATCTVTDLDLDVGVDSQMINVSDNPPVVNIVVNATSGLEPMSVEYNCTVGGGNEPFDYFVDFGDGSASTSASGTHDYPEPDTYSLSCRVTDIDGDWDEDVVGIHVANNPPVVDLIAIPTEGLEGMTVSFTCNVAGGNTPFEYVLDFGDGSSAAASSATHTYPLEGVFNATCNVTDFDGDIGSDLEEITVANNPPVVNLVANVTSGLEPLTVEFNCTVGGGNEPFNYSIDFGDGSDPIDASSAVYTYPREGEFDASCTVSDVDGDVGSDTEHITVLNNPPVVDLIVFPESGPEGTTFLFTCDVTGGNVPLGYVLDLGDGTSTTGSSVVHAYPREGLYNASCTVIDSDGDIGMDDEWVNVTNNAPVVHLELNTTSGFEPLSVAYNCTVGGGNDPLVYEIDFGDSSGTSSSPTGTHDYLLPGDYTMTCTVSDADGDSSGDWRDITVINNPPVVDLVAIPVEGLEGVDVDFTCNVAGGNAPFEYVLDFGDGSSTTGSSATHNYPREGVYNATCTVTDLDLDVGVDSQLINISNNPPVVNVIANVTSGLEVLSVAYNCTVGGGNAPFDYFVEFGDGNTSTSPTGTYDYAEPGAYPLSCRVTDIDGDWDEDVVGMHVENNPPVVDLIAIPTEGLEGMNVSFNCSVTGGNAPIGIVLDFGDGTSTTSALATHNYPREGVYNATCTATDFDLDVGVDSELINVLNNAPVVNLVSNVTMGEEPLSVYFNCTLVAGGNPPYTYSIDFGDGSAPVAAETASHTYDYNSTYDASCTITDVDGDVSVPDMLRVVVGDAEPYTNFTYSPSSPIEGDVISFTDRTTSYDSIVSWSWNFGDGNTSTAANSTHTYYVAGPYLVTLTVTDDDGSATSHVEIINVGNNAPVADVTVLPASGTEPLTVGVNCGVASGGNAPFTYLVLYGDGESTTSTVSAHTYDQDGIYPVLCQVTDNDGDVSSDTQNVVVNDTVPTASFSFEPANPRAGQVVNFTDLSTAYDGIAAWSWDFENDGVVDSTVQNATHTFASPGLYVVNLSVSDADGSTAWTIRTVAVNISVGAPIIFLVQATGITNVSANITWGTDQGADSLVEYGLTPALGSSVADGSIVFNHNLPLSGLAPNTTYYYNVTSCNMFAVCAEAGPYSFTTLETVIPDLTAPGNVTGLGESGVGSSWIEWSWTNPSDSDFNHVEIWVNGTFVANTSGTSYNVTGLSELTTYQVEIITVDNTGNRNVPGVTDDATTIAGPDVTAPGDVSGLGETAVGTDWVNWAWTNPSDLDFNHVELWLNGSFVANTSASSYNVTGLSQNTTYELTVVSVDNTGNRNTPGVSDLATTAPSFVPDLTAPGNVTGLGETGVGLSWINWAWTNPSDLDFNHVELWLNGSFVANTSASSYNVTGLSQNTTYELTVVSVDNTGNRNTPGVADSALTASPVDLIPDVTASAAPLSGIIPLAVQFNATVTGGDAPLSYAWDFDSDGTVDSVLQNPIYIYNVPGVYTAGVNVTDVDGDMDTDAVVITVNSVVHDIAVNSINYTKEGRTLFLYDLMQANASITNEGTVSENFTAQLVIDGVVVDSESIVLDAGESTLAVFSWASAGPEGYHDVRVRALPVAGETDLTEQSAMKTVRVWSVDDLISDDTRDIAYWAGVAYVPIRNAYINESIYDMRLELRSATAIIAPPAARFESFGPNEERILTWSVAAIPGDILTVVGGNEEMSFSDAV